MTTTTNKISAKPGLWSACTKTVISREIMTTTTTIRPPRMSISCPPEHVADLLARLRLEFHGFEFAIAESKIIATQIGPERDAVIDFACLRAFRDGYVWGLEDGRKR